MAVTIRDVADAAGVSFQLVSAVLGGRKYARASEATRAKILEAARKLGYVPNASARILRGDASRIIGVLIDSRAPESMYGVLAEIEHSADELDYRILIAQAHDKPEKLLQAYYSLKQNGVDGIISFSHDYAQFGCRLDSQFEDDPRIVFVLNTQEQTGSSVDVDYHGGIAQALTHLREQGYRKPALLLCGRCVEKLTRGNRKRLDGFLHSCPGGDFFLLNSGGSDIPLLYDECRKLIREKLIPAGIDAIIAHNDDLAALLLKALLAEKVRVPQDFGVIGFDNLPLGEYLPVTLSTLYYDKKELADSVLKILQDRIAGKSAPVRLSCQVKFIPRESSRKHQP